jgi:ubiquinone/menaquinone biosynthesis C-methylase UbiE
MNEFNETNVFASKELGYLLEKYKEKNPLSRLLIKNFYRHIENAIASLEGVESALEVGCGAGISSLRIKQMLQGRYFEVSDVDENAIQQLEKINFPIPFKQESALELKRRDGEFDCVFLLEVLEHVPGYRKALAELFRVSKKYVIVSTPNEPTWRILNILRGRYWKDMGNTPDHVNHWSTKALVKLLGEYGEVIKVFTPLPWTILVIKVPAK